MQNNAKQLLTDLKVHLYHNQMVNDKKETIIYYSLEIDFPEIESVILLVPKDKADKKLLTSYLKVNKIIGKDQ